MTALTTYFKGNLQGQVLDAVCPQVRSPAQSAVASGQRVGRRACRDEHEAVAFPFEYCLLENHTTVHIDLHGAASPRHKVLAVSAAEHAALERSSAPLRGRPALPCAGYPSRGQKSQSHTLFVFETSRPLG